MNRWYHSKRNFKWLCKWLVHDANKYLSGTFPPQNVLRGICPLFKLLQHSTRRKMNASILVHLKRSKPHEHINFIIINDEHELLNWANFNISVIHLIIIIDNNDEWCVMRFDFYVGAQRRIFLSKLNSKSSLLVDNSLCFKLIYKLSSFNIKLKTFSMEVILFGFDNGFNWLSKYIQINRQRKNVP